MNVLSMENKDGDGDICRTTYNDGFLTFCTEGYNPIDHDLDSIHMLHTFLTITLKHEGRI